MADDTPIIRSTISRVVAAEALDFANVWEAKNGSEAVEVARRERPELILIDIKMPGVDGLEAAAIIKAELPRTRLIFLTAYDEFAYVQRALKIGALDYLLKPIRPTKLGELLRKLHGEICTELSASSANDAEIARDVTPAATPCAPERDPVKRAVAFISENYADENMSLAAVANVAHLSPSHLAHRFRECVGVSYKQFLTEKRIEAAKDLLLTTDTTNEAVAEQVGYANVTNFYRLFQRETGMTPAQFRRCEKEPEASSE
ncbi:two-component system response regulator YesN [Rhodopseudomonas julia]|uniref:Two-component system response regulator YesN n=1 Tax=Rhodopseudomonas julia TaxID=200617 RepID=A0ABU0CAT9_9BRAD|nr:response regulator [Rhodopseudomonas julia]MDQ0327656.1 two-component system response regulator YesN [Rhodopseudomonas julia]